MHPETRAAQGGARARLHDRWRADHADCAADSSISSLQQARFVLNQHGRCGPTCLQHLAATAYSTGLIDDC
ncbi:hypothetical protein [Nocardia thailandica]|uniref:hypothetical protein n=1 Tax=Nocardia thailandica TaxID=257275 RepID=UPI0012FBB8BC|nr:hypothetical protein [Nocardia thailandica]